MMVFKVFKWSCPNPGFCHLQYRKARRVWYITLCEHNIIDQMTKFFSDVLFYWLHNPHNSEVKVYSGTSIMRTPLVPSQVSCVKMCPYFEGFQYISGRHGVLVLFSPTKVRLRALPCCTVSRKASIMRINVIIMSSCWINQWCLCWRAGYPPMQNVWGGGILLVL